MALQAEMKRKLEQAEGLTVRLQEDLEWKDREIQSLRAELDKAWGRSFGSEGCVPGSSAAHKGRHLRAQSCSTSGQREAVGGMSWSTESQGHHSFQEVFRSGFDHGA